MADLQVLPIFPTPFGIINFGEQARELNKTLVKNIDDERLNYQVKTETRTFSGTPGAWQSKLGLENYYDSFSLLRDLVHQIALPTLTQFGWNSDFINEYTTTGNFWANVIFDKGGWSQPHTHGTGNTLLAGVYYPKGTEIVENLDEFNHTDVMSSSVTVREEGCLVILDPARGVKGQVKGDIDSLRHHPYYGSSIFIRPRESLLVLFPAWLEHYVTPVLTTEKRYSISFGVNKNKARIKEDI